LSFLYEAKEIDRNTVLDLAGFWWNCESCGPWQRLSRWLLPLWGEFL